MVNGELAQSFDNVGMPIQFIANEEIALDSVVVKIKATVNSNCGDNVAAGNVKSKNKQGERVQSVKKNGQKFRTNEGEFCSNYSEIPITKIILEVIEQPHQILCRIEIDNKEALIPLHDETIVKVDRKNNQVTVSLPPGLLEIYQ